MALARNPKSRPSPPCSYRLRREGVCAPAPLGNVDDKQVCSLTCPSISSSPSGSWPPSASSLPSTCDSTRRYSLGHPERLRCEVLAVHQAAGQGPNPRPRLKEEAHGGHTCHGQPALWVLNRSDAGVPCPLHPTAFVCSSSPSCSIQQPQDDLPSAAQAPKAPLRPAVKGRPARAASYRPISRPPLLQAPQQKKGGGPEPTGSPRPPAHKRAGDKGIFWDGRCWCRIPPRARGAGERLGWVSGRRAAQTCSTEPLRGEGEVAGTPSPGGRRASE